jgi:hypothetical protein
MIGYLMKIIIMMGTIIIRCLIQECGKVMKIMIDTIYFDLVLFNIYFVSYFLKIFLLN